MPKKTPAKKTYAPARKPKLKATQAVVTSATTGWWDAGKRKPAGLRLCARCEAVHYDGHWHVAPNLAAAVKARRKAAGKAGKDVFCEECRYAEHGSPDPKAALFEGELTLDGLTDAREKAEILATVRNAGKRAARRDPLARVIAIDDRGERVRVTTTENQLAVAIGKAVDAAFKGGKLRIAWSSDDLPARVHWTRKK